MMEESTAVLIVLCLGGLGLAYGLYYILSVFSISVKEITSLKSDEESKGLIISTTENGKGDSLSKEQIQNLKKKSNIILSGANTFFLKVLLNSLILVLLLSWLVKHIADKPNNFYRTSAFLFGIISNFLCCYISVIIASGSNYRIVYKSFFGLSESYNIVFKASLVIGFCTVSIALLSLACLIMIYKSMLITHFSKTGDYNDFFESIFAFGLGAATVSLISKIAGGLYAKTADIGGDILVMKELKKFNEDDDNNPVSIYDKIGDNVGGIAGIATDSFSTLALALCSALYIASTSEELVNAGGYYYPLLIIANGILICIFSTGVTSLLSSFISSRYSLYYLLIFQMLFSVVLVLPTFYLIAKNFIPETYNIGRKGSIMYKEDINLFETMLCPIAGLINGLFISAISYYYTAKSNRPVSQVLEATKQGSTINIIFGLALGYISTMVPTILIAGTLFYTYYLLDMFGISLCALGILSTIPVYIAIDASATVADNSIGLGILCGMRQSPIENLKKVEITCNSFGKGYIFASSSMVSLSLMGSYVIISKLVDIDVNTPLIFAGLLIGAMIPYYFSATVLKLLTNGAIELIKIIKQQRQEIVSSELAHQSNEESNNKYHEVLINNSVKKLFYPCFVIFILPIKIGLLFGVKAIAGLLLGLIISGMQLGISSYVSGIAWKNCKSSINDYGVKVTSYEKKQIDLRILQKTSEKKKENSEIIEDEIKNIQLEINEIEKVSDHPERTGVITIKEKDDKFYRRCLKSSMIGDIVGDALKDLSGPILMVCIKLLPVICIVSSHYFSKTSFLIQN